MTFTDNNFKIQQSAFLLKKIFCQNSFCVHSANIRSTKVISPNVRVFIVKGKIMFDA